MNILHLVDRDIATEIIDERSVVVVGAHDVRTAVQSSEEGREACACAEFEYAFVREVVERVQAVADHVAEVKTGIPLHLRE